MSQQKPFPDPVHARPLADEADIGSGEKTPGQLDTEEMIRAIPSLPRTERGRGDEHDAADGAGQGRTRREHDASLERDEPSGNLNDMDPVPPKGS